MERKPTAGMTWIGVLNIVLGLCSCLGALLTMLLGTGLAVIGTAASEAGSGGAEAAAAGGLILLFGIAGLALGIFLFVAGIGVLKVAPWGRSWSLIAAGIAILRTLAEPVVLASFGVGAIIGLVYPIVLIVMCMRQDWKKAFAVSAPAETAEQEAKTEQDFRTAA